MSWFIMTSWGSCNNLGGWDTVGFWDWYASWYLDGSWYLDWDISALTFSFNTAKWGNSDWGWSNNWSYSNWGWSNNWSSTSGEEQLFSVTGFSISFRFWFSFGVTLGNNMSSSWYSKSSWGWENSSWETELALSSQESSIKGRASNSCKGRCGNSSNGWASNSSYYSRGSNLVTNKLDVLFNSYKFGVLGYSSFLAYLQNIN